MELIMNKKDTVCIKLTENELREMGFTYDNLDCNGIKFISGKINTELGINICKNEKTALIEAFADTNGNCLLFMMNKKTYCYSCEKLDDICRYSKALRNLSAESSKLLKDNKKYHLLISVINPVFRDELMLSDFCVETENNIEKKQSFKTVIRSDAIRILSDFI